MSGLRGHLLAILRDHILMPVSVARSSAIIAASYATKKDIHTYYTVPDKKVIVVYDGYQELSAYAPEAEPFDESLKPFFFFAGKVKPRKNVHGIVSAFILFKKRTERRLSW